MTPAKRLTGLFVGLFAGHPAQGGRREIAAKIPGARTSTLAVAVELPPLAIIDTQQEYLLSAEKSVHFGRIFL